MLEDIELLFSYSNAISHEWTQSMYYSLFICRTPSFLLIVGWTLNFLITRDPRPTWLDQVASDWLIPSVRMLYQSAGKNRIRKLTFWCFEWQLPTRRVSCGRLEFVSPSKRRKDILGKVWERSTALPYLRGSSLRKTSLREASTAVDHLPIEISWMTKTSRFPSLRCSPSLKKAYQQNYALSMFVTLFRSSITWWNLIARVNEGLRRAVFVLWRFDKQRGCHL